MHVHKKQDTSEKIMLAAIDLMAKRGYNGVTTEEIAKTAGFSEKTLFRHFQSKQKLLEAAFHHYHYAEEMKTLFDQHITWDLHADLLMICQNYHRIMYQNRKMLQIAMKEGDNLPGFREATHKHPEQLKECLTKYFDDMYKKGKIIPIDSEKMAIAFLYMNYGAALGRINKDPIFTSVHMEGFIEQTAALFTRALTP